MKRSFFVVNLPLLCVTNWIPGHETPEILYWWFVLVPSGLLIERFLSCASCIFLCNYRSFMSFSFRFGEFLIIIVIVRYWHRLLLVQQLRKMKGMMMSHYQVHKYRSPKRIAMKWLAQYKIPHSLNLSGSTKCLRYSWSFILLLENAFGVLHDYCNRNQAGVVVIHFSCDFCKWSSWIYIYNRSIAIKKWISSVVWLACNDFYMYIYLFIYYFSSFFCGYFHLYPPSPPSVNQSIRCTASLQ